jgi:ribosomal-protein-alanine acetyltransferase
MNSIQEPIILREALETDLDALGGIEASVFASDRLSRRSMRRFLESESDCFLVAEHEGKAAGYAIFFMHRGTSLSRLYSIAVSPAFQGRGIAAALLTEGERIAASHERIYMRLEVRKDNVAAIRLYEKLGYRQFGLYEDYYEDHQDALRFQKRVLHYPFGKTQQAVPYYAQTTEFSCGPAALMMAMSAHSRQYTATQREELRIWREATTIFMTSGHGGCDPYGLALAAHVRGFRPVVYVSRSGPLFLDTVRTPEKKHVMTQVYEDFHARILEAGIDVKNTEITQNTIKDHLAAGGIPVILISVYQMSRKKAPHWVAVTAIDDKFVYINDPEIDPALHQSPFDLQYVPISLQSFDRIAQFGQNRLRTAVIVYPSSPERSSSTSSSSRRPRSRSMKSSPSVNADSVMASKEAKSSSDN